MQWVFDDEDVEEAKPFPDKDTFRQQINMTLLVSFLGLEWDTKREKVRCPFHASGRERTPSLHIYNDSAHCYGPCAKSWDAFGLVMEFQHVDFVEAFRWLIEHQEVIGSAVPVTPSRRSSEYLGPANRELVDSWMYQLTSARRGMLHNRLLTDKTIETLGLGWAPDRNAYVIPFWRGKPLYSEVDIVQFRSTPCTVFEDKAWRYKGLPGHNRPSLINRHTVKRGAWAILLCGTFDSALATQDGLIAQSTNGIATFLRKTGNLEILRRVYAPASKVFIVPDNAETEIEPAHKLAALLDDPRYEVRYFPSGDWGKDYTNYRQLGKTKLDFLWECIMARMMESPLISLEHQAYVETLVQRLCEGDWEGVETYLAIFEPNYRPWIINHAIQLLAQFQPYDTFSPEEWKEFREGLEMHHKNYRLFATYLYEWTQKANDNLGGF